jgi:hypothetical protein
MTFFGPRQVSDWSKMESTYGPNGSASSAYIGHTRSYEQQVEQLAWEDPSLRDLADYYRITNIAGSGKGYMRMWPSSIYSEEIRTRVEAGMLSNGKPWDEWSVAFQ